MLWLPAGLLLVILGYEESFLQLHYQRAAWLDVLMPYFTHVGDGLILTGLMSWLLRDRPAAWWLLVATMIAVALLVSLAKGVLFPDWDRPAAVFREQVELFRLSHQPLLRRSFPSGHATTAAAATTLPALALAQRSAWVGLGLGLLGVALAYSRVYIGVHFLGDILAGSLLGVMLGWGLYAGLHRRLAERVASLDSSWRHWLPKVQRGLSLLMLAGGTFWVWYRYFAGG
jgi:undecaprenyl-diphosphatase